MKNMDLLKIFGVVVVAALAANYIQTKYID
jgi:hypothetical protein